MTLDYKPIRYEKPLVPITSRILVVQYNLPRSSRPCMYVELAEWTAPVARREFVCVGEWAADVALEIKGVGTEERFPPCDGGGEAGTGT